MYKKPYLEKILNGEKTQTRRPLEKKPGRSVYDIGARVGVRSGYTKFAGYIIIRKRFRQRLGDISEEDARKEGFKTVKEFQETWKRLYGKWDPEEVVWVYEFELATQGSASKDKPFPQATNPSTPQ